MSLNLILKLNINFYKILLLFCFCICSSNKRNCNLLILDHPGTTLITALIANIPFICYWEKRHFPFSKQAELLLEDFSNIGIYFKDPPKAADKVNKINNSVEKWWSQDKIQQSRKHYIEKHGLISKDWRNDWKKFISSLN